MKNSKEKYASILKKIYQSFSPKGVPLLVKVILALLALLISILITFLGNVI